MTAEILRRAAALMRERAEVASPSPWVQTVWPREVPGVYSQAIEDTHEFDPEIARTLDKPDAEHIASWHPAVALAVADWIDVQVAAHEANERIWRVSSRDPENRWAERGLTVEANLEHHHRDALAVARAYLGEQS